MPTRGVPIPDHVRAASKILRDAFDYAVQLSRDTWDFAVELEELRLSGLSVSDLRWLVCAGFAEHARETTAMDGSSRFFIKDAEGLRFTDQACFVLTPQGRDALAEPAGKTDRLPDEGRLVLLKPCWDSTRQELRLGDKLVKRYRIPSPNQERVLAAFQEENWPKRIDDPLPPCSSIAPQRRLRDTIKGLNRNRQCPIMRFRGDGTGQGICWSPVMYRGSVQPDPVL